MQPTIRLAKQEEKSIVRNMDQYYLYEFSRMLPDRLGLGQDGMFHDEDDYERYWNLPDHYPYLILNGDELSGFALVACNDQGITLDQFFIVAKFQGTGLAERAASLVFDSHRGCWTVRSFLGNEKSEKFWPRVVSKYTNNKFTVGLQEPKRTYHEYIFSNAK